jgi:hypothetical protein
MTTPRQIPTENHDGESGPKDSDRLSPSARNSYGTLPDEPLLEPASAPVRVHQPYPRRYGSTNR